VIQALTLPQVALAEVVRKRVNTALRTADTLKDLRMHLIMLTADLEAALDPDLAPDTVRAPEGYPPPWQGDQAPSTPRGSAAADEYGDGVPEAGPDWR
jgi:hypothetical protein